MIHSSRPQARRVGLVALILVAALGALFAGGRLVGALVPAPHLSRYGLTAGAAGAVAPAGGDQTAAVAAPAAPAAPAPSAAGPIPAGTDPARPYGVPLLRGDWIITKDYAAHGGLRPPPGNNQGAVDFAFWHDKDALGAPVIATHTGHVKLLHLDPTYGNLVYVLGPRWSTTYGHLQDFAVQDGDTVTRGQMIGHMGSTGASTGPHVDYQVWETGMDRNPMDYCACGARGPDTPAP